VQTITLLTDYKGFFGSNYDAIPYRSGFDKNKLKELFFNYNYKTEFLSFSEALKSNNWANKWVLYTSNEEPDYYYKSFIEDVMMYLKLNGANLIPPIELLRANNNKSFMELYKSQLLDQKNTLPSFVFGTLEEAMAHKNDFTYPLVFKPADGAMSAGVALVKNESELIQQIKKHNKTASFKRKIKEFVREKKHIGYKRDSFYQRKFILQAFIPKLQNDWKVLIFGDQVYILKRGVRKNDFRASGSHIGYKAGKEADFPLHKLDELVGFKNKIDIPHISIDYVYDGKNGHVIEFQGIYFGLSTHNYCKEYFIKENGKWIAKPNTMTKEDLYVYSIVDYLNEKNAH
jgi:hypothetical protein